MDPKFYEAASKGNLEFLKLNRNLILGQVTGGYNNVLHVLAQFNQDFDQEVEELLANQSSTVVQSMLSWKNSSGETPLHIAAKNGVLRLSTAFIRCAKKSGSEASKALLRITDGNGETALLKAVRNGDLKMARLFVDEDQRYYKHFPKSMGETPLFIALKKENDDMLQLVISTCGTSSLHRYKGPKGETVLHIAVRRQLEKSLNWIIEKNSKLANQVDTSGWTPLHYAAFSGFIYAAEVLLDIDESLGYIKGGNRADLTALHIAASKGDTVLMHLILQHCPDSWDMLTSRKQNILHLVAGYGLSGAAIKWVLDKPWVANLINEKDEEGNTPIQLYFQVVSSSEDDGKSLVLTHPQVLKVLGMESFDEKESKEQLKNARRRMLSNGWKDHADWLTKNDLTEDDNPWVFAQETRSKRKNGRIEEMRKIAETHLLVAALIATVTFAAGFTAPGGFDQSEGQNQGMAVLRKKAAFIMFVITDTISVITSTIAIVLHFAATFYHDNGRKLHHRYSYALVLILVAMLTMLMAFVSGLYCVLHRSPGLAITVCFLGCIGIFSLCCLVMKAYKDVSRHESPSLILRGLVSKEDEDPPRHENLNVILREIHTE